ncbi:MAG: GEVED domain-containing protein [Candidatus Bathyarchaeia archaeon]
MNDPDGTPNLVWDDFNDGVRVQAPNILVFTITAGLKAPKTRYYINVLIDLNRNGMWDGLSEWVLQNLEVTPDPGSEVSLSWPMPVAVIHALRSYPGPAWMRVSLTPESIPVSSEDPWDGSGVFASGEIEDYPIVALSQQALIGFFELVAGKVKTTAEAVSAAVAQAQAVAAAAATAIAKAEAEANAKVASFAAAYAEAQKKAKDIDTALAACYSARTAVATARNSVLSVKGSLSQDVLKIPCVEVRAKAEAIAVAAADAVAQAYAQAEAIAAAAAQAQAYAKARAEALAAALARARAYAQACAQAKASAASAAQAIAEALAIATAKASAAAAAVSKVVAQVRAWEAVLAIGFDVDSVLALALSPFFAEIKLAVEACAEAAALAIARAQAAAIAAARAQAEAEAAVKALAEVAVVVAAEAEAVASALAWAGAVCRTAAYAKAFAEAAALAVTHARTAITAVVDPACLRVLCPEAPKPPTQPPVVTPPIEQPVTYTLTARAYWLDMQEELSGVGITVNGVRKSTPFSMTFNRGSQVTLTADPHHTIMRTFWTWEGMQTEWITLRFYCWYVNGRQYMDRTITITITGNTQVEAKYIGSSR